MALKQHSMPATDLRIDEYIEKSESFAKPILQHIRKLVHKACPGAEETWKWSFPNFVYKGSILCSMAAFKHHCTFGFWKAALMKDEAGLFNRKGKNAMGQFDRITSLKDLPADKILIAYIKEAGLLNAKAVKLPSKIKADPSELVIPEALIAAMNKNWQAKKLFETFSPSHKREYTEWISGAKTKATQHKRIATALEWISEGKSLNWKYQKR